MVYQSQVDTVTGDLFVSTIFWDRQECRGAGYRSIPEVLQHQLLVDPSAHAFDLEFLIFEVYTILIPLRVKEPVPLFENNTYIEIEIDITKATVPDSTSRYGRTSVYMKIANYLS